MKFRTQIEVSKPKTMLRLKQPMLSLGSCFSRAIGSRLADGGADICVTPMGVLFNPVSIAHIVDRALRHELFTHDDLYRDSAGGYHALAFESRRQGSEPQQLLEQLNTDFTVFTDVLERAECLIVTFGTAWCFYHIPTDCVVGNCHKLPDGEFSRHLCSVDEICNLWRPILASGRRTIFTVSPVRHLNDGLHGNTLSKARLHLAIEQLCADYGNAEYFPAYEALVDDLRDYRFYADDLKHPSPMAEEYIFEHFSDTYFRREDQEVIAATRRLARQSLHRTIIE